LQASRGHVSHPVSRHATLCSGGLNQDPFCQPPPAEDLTYGRTYPSPPADSGTTRSAGNKPAATQPEQRKHHRPKLPLTTKDRGQSACESDRAAGHDREPIAGSQWYRMGPHDHVQYMPNARRCSRRSGQYGRGSVNRRQRLPRFESSLCYPFAQVRPHQAVQIEGSFIPLLNCASMLGRE
jgi:hypothetical protein